jgi:hypothetical protein
LVWPTVTCGRVVPEGERTVLMQQQRSSHIICEDTGYVGRSRETANQLPSGPLMQLQLVLQVIQIKKAIFSFCDTDNLQKQTVTMTIMRSRSPRLLTT